MLLHPVGYTNVDNLIKIRVNCDPRYPRDMLIIMGKIALSVLDVMNIFTSLIMAFYNYRQFFKIICRMLEMQ